MSDDKNDERQPIEVEIRGGDKPSDYIPHEKQSGVPLRTKFRDPDNGDYTIVGVEDDED